MKQIFNESDLSRRCVFIKDVISHTDNVNVYIHANGLNIWIYASGLKLKCCRSNILIADIMVDVTKWKCVPLIYDVYVRRAIIKVFKKINYVRKELSKFCVSLSKNKTHLLWSHNRHN